MQMHLVVGLVDDVDSSVENDDEFYINFNLICLIKIMKIFYVETSSKVSAVSQFFE
jgi:hypothetical protein